MITKLRAFASLFRELGPRWTLFRLAYAFRLRTGLIRLQMPKGEWSDYKHLLAERSASADEAPNPKFFLSVKAPHPERRDERFSRPVDEEQLPENVSWRLDLAEADAYFLIDGMPRYFFTQQLVHTGFPPIWHKDFFFEYVSCPPMQVSQNKHWSQISNDANGDIKFIWEPNRFTFAYALVRAYAASQDEEYPEAFWTLIEDWAQHNPPNTGPNWMDGQEIALRLMAWTFGYRAFLNSPSTTPQRKEDFILYVAAQAERIYKNIGYAISTRSNHTISEAFGLWMVGLLFPELKHAEKYLSLGKKLLEQEAANQIFPDGSYSMYSLNYHRFILHIYLYAIRLGEINDPSLRGEHSSTKQSPTRFSDDVYRAVTKSIEYLSQLINPQTGHIPTYGSNDGALVLPLNNCDFNDYRPLLQLGWYITKGERLFEPGPWDEDVFWLCGESLTAKSAKPAKKKENLAARLSPLGDRELIAPLRGRGESFPNGGIYLLQSTNSHALIHCTDYTSRPSHADQLHMDLSAHGQEIAIDAGTYLYSGGGHWRNGLAHTSVHNTVTVDNKDQMTLVSRFTWTNWSKGKVLKHDKDIWQGEHDGYKPVSHKRTVMSLEGDRWLVIDNLIANELHNYKLHWLLNDYLFEHNGNSILLTLEDMKYKMQIGMVNGNSDLSVVRADPDSTRGWRSRYYGHKEPAISVILEAGGSQVTFWSFFGAEDDAFELDGDTLKINSETIQL